MKKYFKKILVLVAIIIFSSVTFNLTTIKPVHAYDVRNMGDCGYLLGMTSWDCGIKPNPTNESELTANVVKIASNILIDIGVLSAYLVLGFVIYGGYQYMLSSGDPTKAAAGRKTLTRAFIGLAIILLANIILNAVRMALIGDKSLTTSDIVNVDANELFIGGINFAISIAGIVCLIFIIIGGVSYITSTGDSTKLQKAKNTILYAIIGLIIVGLAFGITAFVSNLIRSAGEGDTGYINQTTIAKELNEK